MMKPLSPHWADIAAAKLVADRGPKDIYTLASGVTPSGVAHIGNFREVITVDLVDRALQKLGKKTRFIYSWDDFDTFRKVPVNFPRQEDLKAELRKPISRVFDPWGREESYARANEKAFEDELKLVGVYPQFIYQHAKYSNGDYAEEMKVALNNAAKIRAVLDKFRKEPLGDDWVPTTIYCENCGLDSVEDERFDGEWTYSYSCTHCAHKGATDIRKTKNLKLNWRTDWPMRWAYEGVDFEPGGKDHSSEGGSFDTAKDIVRVVWGKEPPQYLQYDFVSIKGVDGKMSSSKGVLFTLTDALAVYTPEMVRWIFASQRPNHDFSLAFDEDVIKVYDEFDRMEAAYFDPKKAADPKEQLSRRIMELSNFRESALHTQPFRAGFRALCNRLQVCDGDIERTKNRFYQNDIKTSVDEDSFMERARCAWTWVEKHASSDFRYRLNQKRVELQGSDGNVLHAVGLLRKVIEQVNLETIDPKEFYQKILDEAVKPAGIDSKVFYTSVYQLLISRDQGPRLPQFLKEIGRDRLLELL